MRYMKYDLDTRLSELEWRSNSHINFNYLLHEHLDKTLKEYCDFLGLEVSDNIVLQYLILKNLLTKEAIEYIDSYKSLFHCDAKQFFIRMFGYPHPELLNYSFYKPLQHACTKLDIRSIRELCKHTGDDFIKVSGFGPALVEKLKCILEERGLKLRSNYKPTIKMVHIQDGKRTNDPLNIPKSANNSKTLAGCKSLLDHVFGAEFESLIEKCMEEFKQLDSESIGAVLGSYFKGLPIQGCRVLVLRHFYKLTYAECGLIFDLTLERIRQIEMKALRMLRHPDRTSIIRSLGME